MSYNPKAPVRIAVNFPSAEAAVAWFEAAQASGQFGVVVEPEFKDWPEDVRPMRPRSDLALRAMDSLDIDKIGMDNTFVVSHQNDGGKYLTIEEETTTTPVVKLHPS